MNVKTNKKLIEVALPLEAINEASAREKSIRHGNPSTLHIWWARRPLAAARAVIFAQMVDDPSAHPDIFPTPEKQDKERQRLFRVIEELVKWENTNNETALQAAREEIWQSWRRTCAENADHPQAKELFNRHILPAFHDPFAGGGTIPLEAQRLGLEAYASDLNPVAVLINKAMIEIPPKFAGKPPVNPEARRNMGHSGSWKSASGLADDVLYYGRWMRGEAEKYIGHLYPKVEITEEMSKERTDLKPMIGEKLTVVAWIWVRTVRSPNPAFSNTEIPLASTFVLSSKSGNEAYIDPIINGNKYRFVVKVGKPKDPEKAQNGTKLTRANFKCLISGIPVSGDYIKSEGQAGRMGKKLMAVIAEGNNGRIYLSPTHEMEIAAMKIEPSWQPDLEISGSTQYIGVRPYGMKKFSDLFTDRQIYTLSTFAELVQKAINQVKKDARNAGLKEDEKGLEKGGIGASAYAEAIGTYLGLAVGRCTNYWSTLTPWSGEFIVQTFSRQAIPIIWDFAEGNPFSDSTGNWNGALDWIVRVIEKSLSAFCKGVACQSDAQTQKISITKVVSTDPPYYDNVPYADLSDYFYVWLRHSLKSVYPDLFTTLAVPKSEELVAFAYRHNSKEDAEKFFLNGMMQAMQCIVEQAHKAFPVTIYYAFKQSETETELGTASTGWETFLDAIIKAGFAISGTWPIRTEREGGFRNNERNSLASSIVLVCRPRSEDAKTTTRRDFIARLKSELPNALKQLQRGNIAPVDLEQAAIGPGMAIYTNYEKVVDAEGQNLSVRDALRLINQVLYEILTEQEGDFDSDTRWALVWFDKFGFDEGDFGTAEQLSKSKTTSVEGMVSAGILTSRSGRVRLFKPEELPSEWDPEKEKRLTVWEMTHQLIRALEAGGENSAAELVNKLGSKAEIARELAYRLYTVSERKKRSTEAGLYNSLVKSWPEILRLAQEKDRLTPRQGQMI